MGIGTAMATAAGRRCTKCGHGGVIQISLTLHTEEHLTFQSCHKCEHKWWEAPQDSAEPVVPLAEVLNRAKVVRKSA
ncbi:MAG: hypothetical protein K1X95_08680 [Acidimicrobiia bacterium]|nr:hypothetical protein [Acidimicrobiia bacterium]